ncbi:MAG: calcium/sodium antiporter [Pseudorhodobacter sp.]
MEILYILGGLIGLFLGGEALLRGAVGLAQAARLSPLVIGLTVVGFGTSTPELLVSLKAALDGVPDIALGNVVGSNIANILLILGVSALIWPLHVQAGGMRRDALAMVGAAVMLLGLVALGTIGRAAGLALVLGLVAYLWIALRQSAPDDAAPTSPERPIWASALWVGAGLAGLMLGAGFLVDGAVILARKIGMSEAFIGLTIVAVGTSLPELATSLVAALRRQSDIALGNIIGSNIFNVLGILGLTAAITPVAAEARFAQFDVPVMLAVSVVFGALLWRGNKIGRVAGALSLGLYVAYVWAAQG